MNEVSNGPSGNKEYVEFVVIDTVVVYDCNGSAPPCIDIRGWIFDDNSGLHGTGGIATGAVRFSNDVLWSCVPLGTIILIYNDADINPAIPPIDIIMTDGNCRIVAPISNAILFETNLTTPGAVLCSYPSTGWTAGGLWSTTLLANTGDCARIVDLAGCEVFSVCWATCSISTLIYFLSGSSGTDNIWFFNDGDPSNQTNWSEGCADISSCGLDEQTPGSPNNAANAGFIAQFNNNCSAITPISSSLSAFTNTVCLCDGTATVTPSGSIPGYTFVWYDSTFSPIGQTDSIATGLCAATYNVISTSLIGCSDTTTVNIILTGIIPVVTVVPTNTVICLGDSTSLTASGALTYSWTPSTNLSATTGSTVNAFPTTLTTYIVTGTNGSGCTDTASVYITVNPLPIISIPAMAPVCENQPPFLVTATPTGGTWLGTGISTGGMFDPSGLAGIGSTVTYSFTDTNGCTNSASVTINVSSLPVISISSPGTLCDSGPPINLSATPLGGSWSGTGITNATTGTFDPAITGAGIQTVYYTAVNGACTITDSITIIINSGTVVSINSVSPICENQSPIILTASPTGGVWTGIGVTSSGVFDPALFGDGTYQIIYTVTGSGFCTNTDTIFIIVDDLPIVNIDSVSVLCDNALPIILTANLSGGVWSGSGITNSITGEFSPLTIGAGTYTISYTVISGSCTAVATTTIDVISSPTINIIALGPLIFCEGGSVVLVANGAAGNLITWSNGTTGDTLTVSGSGNYFATINSSCGADTSNNLVVIVNTVNASFILNPSTGQSPLTVQFTNTTANTLSYSWQVADTVYAVNQDSSIIYNDEGTYTITLYVISTDGCIDSITQTIFVYGEFNLIIPNVFTPNGDLLNDNFSIITSGVKSLEVTIFNRWGQLLKTGVFDNLVDGKNVVWDGTANGEDASDGSYAYLIKAIAFAGQEMKYHGFVALLSKK